MQRVLSSTILVLAGLVAVSPAVAAETPSVHPKAFAERPLTAFDRAAFAQQQKELHTWLVENQVRAGLAAPIEVRVTAEEARSFENPSQRERRVRVGVSKPVGERVSLGHGSRPARGAMRTTASGVVWTAALQSPGASALRVRFTGFSLPTGAELYLYNDTGMVRGPYTGRGPGGSGEFWSHTVFGSELFIQVHQVDSRPPATFEIAEVGHMGSRFRAGSTTQQGHCSDNAECVENAECGTNSAVNDAKGAVALILFQSRGGFFICSGGLLADTDNSSTIPYFLTANHCISKGREASSLETFFDFTASCGTTNCQGIPNTATTLGSTIAGSNRTSDYTLLVLDQMPGGATYLGWNSAPVAFTNGEDLYRISHPAGSPQAYSEHEVDTSKTTCSSWPRGNWIYSHDLFGATEGGSSGSPVVNSAGQVVGQLSGGCGFNVGDVCDADSNATVDGAFAAYFDDVAQFLDPDGGPICTPDEDPEASCSDGEDNDCDGLVDGDDPDCGGGGCVPTHNKEKGPRCSDGVDNDCDGLIDGADPDC